MNDAQLRIIKNPKLSILTTNNHPPHSNREKSRRDFFEGQSSISTLIRLQAAVLIAISLVIHAIMAANSDDAQTVAVIATLPFTLLISGTIPFYVETRRTIQENSRHTTQRVQELKHALIEYERDSEPIWLYLMNTLSSKWAIMFQQWLYEEQLSHLKTTQNSDSDPLRMVLQQELAIYAMKFDKEQLLVEQKDIDPSNSPIILNSLDKKTILQLLAAQTVLTKSRSFERNNRQIVTDDPLYINLERIESLLINHKIIENISSAEINTTTHDEDLISRRLETWTTSHTLCRVEAENDARTYPTHRHLRILLSIDGEEKYPQSNSGFSNWLFPSDENVHWLVLNRLRKFPSQRTRALNNPENILDFQTLAELIQLGVSRHVIPLQSKTASIAEKSRPLNLDYHSFVEDAELFGDLFNRFTDPSFMENSTSITHSATWSEIPQSEKLLIRCLVYFLNLYFAVTPEDIYTPRRFKSEIELLQSLTENKNSVNESSPNSIPMGHPARKLRNLWILIRRNIDEHFKKNSSTVLGATPLLAFEMTHHQGPLQNWIRASNAVHRRFSAMQLISEIESLQNRKFQSVLTLPLIISQETVKRFFESSCEIPHSNQDNEQISFRLSVASLATIEDNSLEKVFMFNQGEDQ